MNEFFKTTLIVFASVIGASLLFSLSYVIAYQKYLIKKLSAQPGKYRMPHYRWVVMICLICTFFSAVIAMCGAIYEEQSNPISSPEPYFASVYYDYGGERQEIRIYENSSYTELPSYGPNDDLCDFSGWYFDMLFTDPNQPAEIEYTRNIFNMLKGTSFSIQLFPRWASPQRQEINVWEELSKAEKLLQDEYAYIYSPYGLIKNQIEGYYDFTFDGMDRDVVVEGIKYESHNGVLRAYLGGWKELQGNKVSFLAKDGELCDDFRVKITLAELKDGDTVVLEAGSSAMYKLDVEKGVYSLDMSNGQLCFEGVFHFIDKDTPHYEHAQWVIPIGRSSMDTILGAEYRGYPINYVQIYNTANTYQEGVFSVKPAEEEVTAEDSITAPKAIVKIYRFTAPEYGRYTFTNSGISGITTFYDSSFSQIYSVSTGVGSEGNFDMIVLEEGETVHLFVYNAYQNVDISVRRMDTPFEWYVNGNLVCHSTKILRSGPWLQISVLYNGTAVKARIRSIDNFVENIHEYYSSNIIYKPIGISPSSFPAGTRIVLEAYEEDWLYSSVIELTIVE